MVADQQIKLFELVGENTDCTFSPFVWRVKLALQHKGLTYETIPWHYTEKDKIKPSDKVRVDTRCCNMQLHFAGQAPMSQVNIKAGHYASQLSSISCNTFSFFLTLEQTPSASKSTV